MLSITTSNSEGSPLQEKPFTPTLPSRFVRSSENSQLSTSSDSANSSPRNQNKESDRFPILVLDKIQKSKSKARRQSLKDSEILDDTVTEEGEELEGEKHFLKKLPAIADGEGFMKKTHIDRFAEREEIFSNKTLKRCGSLETSFLPLDSVEEDKNEEELKAFKTRRSIKNLHLRDFNEFNQTEKSLSERKDFKSHSSQLQLSEGIILEEQENKVLPHFPIYLSANSSRRGSICTPVKLKVDEIDFLEKKLEGRDDDSDDETRIDTIIEEIEEKNAQVEDNKEYQVAKHKLDGEREFLKKVLKGEMIDECDSVLSKISLEREFTYIGSDVIQEVIEEDKNENVGYEENLI
jgi:hypothetical protein